MVRTATDDTTDVSTPNTTAADVLARADGHDVDLRAFDPDDDIRAGMVAATHSDPALAELVVIDDVFEGDDGRTRVRVAYPERTHVDGTLVRETLASSFADRVAFDGSWVVVPYSARTADGKPYNCHICNRFGYIHEGVADHAFASGGCDSCGAVFTHDQLVDDGAVVELLL